MCSVELKIGVSVKNQNRMTNDNDSGETALYESSHQDLYCLQTNVFVYWAERAYLCWVVGTQCRYESDAAFCRVPSESYTVYAGLYGTADV